jgi:hypothetical protein
MHTSAAKVEAWHRRAGGAAILARALEYDWSGERASRLRDPPPGVPEIASRGRPETR